ncbi:nucleotidyltransferase family protein [Paenibacillus rigui]|uniref:nucleotidyltransferase family protein n=1 Tax=Paenibacillus rigui TaxID=554312 RepID=UPI002481EDF3|nr:nucleotidyltransferase family protein [Paenibacillus rigui]
MAAGLGTRLRPLTNQMPKCLVPIKGKPLLEIWLELLEKHGVTEVLINLHYKAEMVHVFLQQYNGPIRVHCVYEEQLLGSAGTIRENQAFVQAGEPFFIINADNLTNINLTRMMEAYLANPSILFMALFQSADPQSCGIAVLGERQMITGFVEKPVQPKSNLANAGIYIADERLFSYLTKDTPADLGTDVFPQLIGIMKGYMLSEYLLDIGTMEAYLKAQEEWPYDY